MTANHLTLQTRNKLKMKMAHRPRAHRYQIDLLGSDDCFQRVDRCMGDACQMIADLDRYIRDIGVVGFGEDDRMTYAAWKRLQLNADEIVLKISLRCLIRKNITTTKFSTTRTYALSDQARTALIN